MSIYLSPRHDRTTARAQSDTAVTFALSLPYGSVLHGIGKPSWEFFCCFSVYSSGGPGTHFVDQSSLKLRVCLCLLSAVIKEVNHHHAASQQKF